MNAKQSEAAIAGREVATPGDRGRGVSAWRVGNAERNWAPTRDCLEKIAAERVRFP